MQTRQFTLSPIIANLQDISSRTQNFPLLWQSKVVACGLDYLYKLLASSRTLIAVPAAFATGLCVDQWFSGTSG